MTVSTTLFDIGQELQAAVEAKYAAELIPLPDRRFVAEGTVVWDCEQLTVRFIRSFSGLPGAPRTDPMGQRCAQPRSAEYEVALIRCSAPIQSTSATPTVAAMETSAETFLRDAWLLPIAIAEAASDGLIGGGCSNVVVGSLTGRGPEGGYGGNQVTVEVGLV